MKKRMLSWLLALAMVLQMVSGVAVAAEYPTPTNGAQDALAKFENGTPMSVSHRAAWRNGPECSLIAIYESILMGIDVAELDVKITSDGVPVLMHDTSISRTTTGSGNVESMTWEELKAIPVEDAQGGTNQAYTLTEADVALLKSLPHYVEHCGEPVVGGTMPTTRLDDAIDLIKMYGPNTMINWDHCMSEYRFVPSYLLFCETGMLDNVFFKNSNGSGTQLAWYEAAAAAWNEKYPEAAITAAQVNESVRYVYITHSAGEKSVMQGHLDAGVNLVMTEICIGDDAADASIQAELEPWCKEKGIAMFVNTMWSGLCSTKADTETTWAEMLDRGYKAIQTDQASELAGYLAAYNSVRSAASVIQAEHFHNFNYDDSGLYVAESADSNLNKKVEGMESGDWMEYRHILFDGSEVMLNLNMKGQAGGVLAVYLDGMAAENRIAQVNLTGASGYQLVSAELQSAVAAGDHTVYLQASGVADTDLVSIDHFQFVSSSAFAGEVTVEEVSVTTSVGTAPSLPSHVEVVVDTGADEEAHYGLEVRWEQVAAEKYAAAGTFTVLGYVPVLSKYIEATVTVAEETVTEPGVKEDGLVLWLDASQGVELGENGAVTSWTSKVGHAASAAEGEEATAAIVATLNSGSPTWIENAAGQGAGIWFDGDDSFSITMPENFWNSDGEDADYTVLMFTSSEQNLKFTDSTEEGVHGSNRSAQFNSVMYFGEFADWGSVHFAVAQNQVNWRFGSGTSGDRGDAYIRPATLGAQFTATAVRKQGITDSLFIDGEWIYTGSADRAATANSLDTGWIGLGKEGNYYKGTICEILIYDRALSDDEILAVQQAMAQKYADPVAAVAAVEVTCEAGTAPVLPQTVEVTYASGRVVAMGVTWEKINPNNYVAEGTFEAKGVLANGKEVTAKVTVVTAEPEEVFPITTDGLLFWLDASAGVTADPDGKVTGWASQTANGYQATNKKGDASLAADAINGHPGVVFDGDEDVLQMVLDSDALNSLDGVTVIVYGASDTAWKSNSGQSFDWNVQRGTLFYVDEAGGWGSFYTGIYKDAISARFGTGASQDYGFRQERLEEMTDPSVTVIRWDGSTKTYDVDVDGTDFGTGSSKAAATANNKNIVYLGTGKENSYWAGTVGDILVYTRVLTDAQLDSIYNYLEDKYAPVVSDEPKPIPVTGIYLKEEGQQLTVTRGETIRLTASAVPANAANTQLVWSSNNANVAAVDQNGNVSAVGFGYAVITVATEDGNYQAYCNIFVDKTEADKIWQNIQDILDWAAKQDETDYWNWDETLGAAIGAFEESGVTADSSAVDLMAQYTSLRDAMRALLPPVDYVFTQVSQNQTVELGAALTVEILPDSKHLLSVLVDENSIEANQYTFTSAYDNPHARSTGGMTIVLHESFMSQLPPGEHTLRVMFADESTPVETTFTVICSVTGVKLTAEKTEMVRGTSIQLKAVVTPANAANTKVTYKSSNPKIASVDETGKVMALGIGKVTITVTTVDGGHTDTCEIRVVCDHALTYTAGGKDATCTSKGYTGDQICQTCGVVTRKGQSLSKTGHSYSDHICTKCGASEPGTTGNQGGTATAGSPTGDSANPMLWVTLICMAGGVGICLVYGRRRMQR